MPSSPAAGAKSLLERLPLELQCIILDHVIGEDAQGRMAAANRHFNNLVEWHCAKGPMSAAKAARLGHRHALARALGAPDDASEFATGARDKDGMTQVMHAVRTNKRALLRCLLRHTQLDIAQTDHMGLTARDWAILVKHEEAFKTDWRRTGRAYSASANAHAPYDLHHAIAKGHRALGQVLIGIYRSTWDVQNHYHTIGAFDFQTPLSCGKLPLLCALHHAPLERPMLKLLAEAPNQAPLTPADVAQLGAEAPIDGLSWRPILDVLVSLGFDVHAAPPDASSYVTRWLKAVDVTLDNSKALAASCRGAQASAELRCALMAFCLGRARELYVTRRQYEPIVIWLVQQGTWPKEAQHDVDKAARIIARVFGLPQALWDALRSGGARLDATDAQGQGLAHAVMDHPDDFFMINALEALLRYGLDITRPCAQHINPLLRVVTNSDTNALVYWPARLSTWRDLGAKLDAPGLVQRDGRELYAASLFEAALMCGNMAQARYCIDHNIATSREHLVHAKQHLDAHGVSYNSRWLARRIRACRLSLTDQANRRLNFAGSCHALLSRPHLHAARDKHCHRPMAQHDTPAAHFWHTVKSQALTGGLVARHMAVPITRTTDAILGTQRHTAMGASQGPVARLFDAPYRPLGEMRAGGVAGIATGAAGVVIYGPYIAVTSALCWPAFGISQAYDDNPTVLAVCGDSCFSAPHAAFAYGIDGAVLQAVVQAAALVGLVPKLLVTGTGMAAGALSGVVRGAIDYPKHKRARARMQAPLPM